MLFTILLASLLALAVLAGLITYHAKDYNKGEDAGLAVFLILVVGGLIGFVVLLGASSAASKDTKNHVPFDEKTYTIAEGSVPSYKDRKLEFSYVEDGKILPFSQYVYEFPATLEKPKALKITKYDVEDWSILPWVIDDSIKAEIIK